MSPKRSSGYPLLVTGRFTHKHPPTRVCLSRTCTYRALQGPRASSSLGTRHTSSASIWRTAPFSGSATRRTVCDIPRHTHAYTDLHALNISLSPLTYRFPLVLGLRFCGGGGGPPPAGPPARTDNTEKRKKNHQQK